MYKKELAIAKLAARSAGIFLARHFWRWHRGTGKYKANSELVTWCDKSSENIIIKQLKKAFPDYGFLSEESGQSKNRTTMHWIIDPLDGTTNFSIHHPLFSTSIALAYGNEVVMGVTYSPILKEMYWATKKGGSWRDGKRLHVSKNKNLKKSLITFCHGTGAANTEKSYKLERHFHNINFHTRHFGSTTMELAMLAAGSAEAHLVPGGKVWDIAAGTILVKEAGGKVTDWQNNEWHIGSKTILASNNVMHKTILAELKKIKLAK